MGTALGEQQEERKDTEAGDTTTTSIDAEEARQRAELIVVQSFMRNINPIAEQLYGKQQSKGTSENEVTLTEFEKDVFSKYTYYNWGYGLATITVLFGGIFGGLRLAAYRRFLKDRALPSSPAFHARTARDRQRYNALDKKRHKNSKKSNTPPANRRSHTNERDNNRSVSQQNTDPDKEQPFRIMADEIAVQVQFYVTSCFSVIMGLLTANIFSDRNQFQQDLAMLPTQPGKSRFCHQVCPILLQHRQRVLSMENLRPFYDEQQEFERNNSDSDNDDDDDNSSANDEQPPPPSVMEIMRFQPSSLWEDPLTTDLENMVEMVQNCQRRIEFEQECRKRKHRVDEASGLVDVPEPGVPLQYIRSDEDSHHGEFGGEQ